MVPKLVKSLRGRTVAELPKTARRCVLLLLMFLLLLLLPLLLFLLLLMSIPVLLRILVAAATAKPIAAKFLGEVKCVLHCDGIIYNVFIRFMF